MTGPAHIIELPRGLYLELAGMEIRTPFGVLRFIRPSDDLVVEVHFSKGETSPPAPVG